MRTRGTHYFIFIFWVKRMYMEGCWLSNICNSSYLLGRKTLVIFNKIDFLFLSQSIWWHSTMKKISFLTFYSKSVFHLEYPKGEKNWDEMLLEIVQKIKNLPRYMSQLDINLPWKNLNNYCIIARSKVGVTNACDST